MTKRRDAFWYKCAVCGFRGQLYRPYGEFFRPWRLKCKEHVPWPYKDWYVELCVDVDGSVWGYTSAPDWSIEDWRNLPSRRIGTPILALGLTFAIILAQVV